MWLVAPLKKQAYYIANHCELQLYASNTKLIDVLVVVACEMKMRMKKKYAQIIENHNNKQESLKAAIVQVTSRE